MKTSGIKRRLAACIALAFCTTSASAGSAGFLFKAPDPSQAKHATPLLLAASANEKLPSSRDALFGDDEAPKQEAAPKQVDSRPGDSPGGSPGDSKASLFGDDLNPPQKPRAASTWKGFIQEEIAHTTAAPARWSKILTRAEIENHGRLNDKVKYKLSARLDYDAVYDLHKNHYPADVRNNQKLNFNLRENYLDVDAGDWDFRLGRQQVVWGEVVGLFFADVVSAKDDREFILPDFDVLRIPQWAARAEYFKNDFHAELLWIPVPTYDEIGKPGANFFPGLPAVSGFVTQYQNELRPERTLGNTNYGLRLSTLNNGWDVSGFYYHSLDAAPTFYRNIVLVPQPTLIYQARHDRIQQFGGTVAKDLGSVVLKGEAVYTHGRQFNVTNLTDSDGVVPQSTLDWVASLDFDLPAETRLNLQLFQRVFFNHNPDIISDKYENGFSVLLNGKLTNHVEAQALWIASLNRSDWLLRPSVTWTMEKNLRLRFGADIFQGPPLGLFGRFDNQDRVYTELRYSY